MAKRTDGPFEFRISDALEVPHRGYLLRLKLLDGEPVLGDLAPGQKITLRSPDGIEGVVAIKDYSLTQGPPSQKRFDRTHELDVVIETADAVVKGQIVDIGWTATRGD